MTTKQALAAVRKFIEDERENRSILCTPGQKDEPYVVEAENALSALKFVEIAMRADPAASQDAIDAAWKAFNTAPSGIDEMRVALIAAAPFIRAQAVEECTRIVGNVPDDPLFDADEGFVRRVCSFACAKLRALIPTETKETL